MKKESRSLYSRYKIWKKQQEPMIREWRFIFSALKRNYLSLFGIMLILAVVTITIFGDWIAPYDPFIQDIPNRLQPPSTAHLLGTDQMGRDILSRIIYGSRYSLTAGFTTVLIASIIGIPLGLISGYRGGTTDLIIMRITDAFLAFPSIILALLIAVALGPSLINSMVALSVSWWPSLTRLVRGCVLSEKEKEYIEAAKAVGEGETRIIFRHILPNISSPLLVQITLNLGIAILMTASLSFVGAGAQPPMPEWGVMINEGRRYITQQWWLSAFPGLAIFLTVLGFNLFGDALRDALDPRLRK